MSGKKTKNIIAFWTTDGSFIVYNRESRQYHFHGKYAHTKSLIQAVKDNNAVGSIARYIVKMERSVTTIMG